MLIKDITTCNAVLEPLLNLTAHSTPNKADFCRVNGALDFIINNLTICGINGQNNQQSQQQQPLHSQILLAENVGGILRNISSYIVTQDDIVELLHQRNVFKTLLDQLKSNSLVIVSNACITLANLSGKSVRNQQKLRELNACKMLHSLTNSKHETIRVGSTITMKHLLESQINNNNSSNQAQQFYQLNGKYNCKIDLLN